MRDQAEFRTPLPVELSDVGGPDNHFDYGQASTNLGLLKQLNSEKNESVSKTSASNIIDGFSIDLKQPLIFAEAVCTTGWATVYEPTGNLTADGSRYTGPEQMVAVDLKKPVLDTTLGSKVVITNLNNNETTTQIVRDYGGFGDPKKYGTPNGQPRIVDLTHGAAARIRAGDMTPVKVCVP